MQACTSATVLKYAVIYVYEGSNTYDQNWRNVKVAFDKVSAWLQNLSGGKYVAQFDLLGEKQINDYCWNPATLLSYKFKGDDYTWYTPTPGSQFKYPSIGLGASQDIQSIDISSCPHCANVGADQNGIMRIADTCSNPIPDFSVTDGGFTAMKQRLLNQFTNNPGQYRNTFIIFGKYGPPTVDSNYQEWMCQGMQTYIQGYSNLAFGEYTLLQPHSAIDCSQFKKINTFLYPVGGSKLILHEILHTFGAVDVYNPGTVLNINWTHYNEALAADPNVSQSIMGNIYLPCNGLMNQGVCTQNQIDSVYLDLYNRKIMAW